MEKNMALHLAVFALLGVGFVVVAWFAFPGPEYVSFLASAVFGVVGSVLGGLIPWYYWPTAGGQFNYLAIPMALLGAGLLFWAYGTYARFAGAGK
jgi:uncharacterized membrane protein YeaQ/YmgE (transglycosylase-associated protein family)